MKTIRSSSRYNNSTSILGVHIDDLPLDSLLLRISEIASNGDRAIISNVNVHAINIAYEQTWFREFLNQSDIVFCDGFGIVLGGLLIGNRIKNRYTPPDWIDQLIGIDDGQFSFFFIGGQPGVAERAGEALQRRNPHFKLVGTQHGYFDKAKSSPENEVTIRQINELAPNFLMVGFGMPMQERWILENLSRLKVNIIMPVGAMFDYVAGDVARAPRWMTDHGLEWLGRLLVEPCRLWKRYIIGNPLFFWRVFIHEILGKSLPN
jgi:N-acetylglucosaminyldiphosphoundecaprenol N-acetyl-beta-D-mannosaminyltransferase